MKQVSVSSKGQVAIPKAVRQALSLGAGTRLTLDVRGSDIVLRKVPDWKQLRGAASPDLMKIFAAFKKRELPI